MYNFWDYVGGWIIMLAFLIPVAGAVLIQVSVFLVAMFGSVLGVGTQRSNRDEGLLVRVRSYDYDEDR